MHLHNQISRRLTTHCIQFNALEWLYAAIQVFFSSLRQLFIAAHQGPGKLDKREPSSNACPPKRCYLGRFG